MVLLSKKLTRLTNIQLKHFITYKNSNNGTEFNEYITKTVNSYLSSCITIENYIKERFNLTKEELEDFNFYTLKVEDLVDYREYLKSLGLKKSSINQKLVCFSTLLKYLLKSYSAFTDVEEDNHLKELINTLKGRGTVKVTDRLIFTKKELSTLNKFIVNFKIPHRERALAMFLILRDTLCQRDDLTNIKLSDIHLDVDNPYVIVPTGSNEIPQKHLIKQDTVLAINSYLLIRMETNIDSDYLFISNRSATVSSDMVYCMFKEIFIGAGFGYLDANGEMKTDYTIESLRWSFKNVI